MNYFLKKIVVFFPCFSYEFDIKFQVSVESPWSVGTGLPSSPGGSSMLQGSVGAGRL